MPWDLVVANLSFKDAKSLSVTNKQGPSIQFLRIINDTNGFNITKQFTLPNHLCPLHLINMVLSAYPPSLESLIMDVPNFMFYKYDHKLACLPLTLINLLLIGAFNSPVNCLPPSITVLTFENLFNQPVDHLPPTLLNLSFGARFNHSVKSLPPTLPPTLIDLSFGECFDHPVYHLPLSLKRLAFDHECGRFNQPDHFLPPNLLSIEFSRKFRQSISSLPSSIQELALCSPFNSITNPPDFPPNVACLSLIMNFTSLFLFFPLSHIWPQF